MDTLKNIFEGNKELFKGLYIIYIIYDKWYFNVKYPVIKIDGVEDFQTLDSLKSITLRILDKNHKKLGIKRKSKDVTTICLRESIIKAYKKYYQKYLNLNKDICVVGIEFCKNDKNVCDFEWEKVENS